MSALLQLEGVDVSYGGGGFLSARPGFRAVRGVSFEVAAGETYALVGESGSGKSSVVRAVAGLHRVSAGRILFDGADISRPVSRRAARFRREIQIVFQNPDASLNPRHAIATVLGRALAAYHGLSGRRARDRSAELLGAVRLDPAYLDRRPGELSGGERQRVAIARALAAEPRLILCDEILSALDVSVQASILALLRDLQAERRLAYLFISHDLAVVRWLAHRVGVLYRGELCETGPAEALFAPPAHPYTEMLLGAVPRIGARAGGGAEPAVRPASAGAVAAGCPFAGRCPRQIGPVCEREAPPLHPVGPAHAIRCHIPPADLLRAQTEARAPSDGALA
jgi:peptide/nickel transport system ATP-binding protein